MAADVFPSFVNCLPRSLVITEMLQQCGVFAELRIGVRIASSGLIAHAWVEVEGAPVNDSREVVDQFDAFDVPVTPVVVSAMQ